ncbi:MAG TPA: pyruvate kinase [Rhodospirillaceae bacterium]|nr:MAG: pyruvate kinase [Alphaproteobacteria bacterium GWF2_58_20]HAU28668.1 pyruvate kinase [Rhodospirillaceae bacterium]
MQRKEDVIRRNRKTKIVATLGPASATPEMIKALFLAGVDVFRLNFSHGKHEGHGEKLAIIRALEQETGRPIGIIADLQGPKLRIGTFKNGSVTLEKGARIRLDLDETPGDETRVCLPHPEVMAALDKGADVLLDDGKVHLRVVERTNDHLVAEVIAGHKLSDHKGFNIPNVVLPLSALTEKDREDLAYALSIGVDFVALSFVQRPEDVIEARHLIGDKASIIIKLEKPSAIECLDELISLTDAVMVARGDLGVEIPPEAVPGVQKRIITMARAAGKPVIVATQMLESMISAPTPTRAEASDVANAVFDGTDAVMLSAESASGEYPLEAVSIMDRILIRVEGDELYRTTLDAHHPRLLSTAADAISSAARQVAETIDAVAIATYTENGSTTLRAARERPPVPILALSPKPEIARRVVLSYGVHCHIVESFHSLDAMVENACKIAFRDGLADVGERIVITAGVPFGTPGSTNLLRIAWVE